MLKRKRSFSEAPVDRRYEIQAAIMRVLKHHETLHQDDMTSLVVEQCAKRFCPSASDIIREVVYLIEHDYIARSDSDR